MTRRRSSPAAAPSPLEDDDLLWEILLRLRPHPSSLPRASAVCRRWRRLARDPKFRAGFRAHHHREPPLLGVFRRSNNAIAFTSVLDPPDRIPAEQLDMRRYGNINLLGCRHGLVLATDWCQKEVHVCDPVTGEQHRVAVPPELRIGYPNGAVLCPAAHDQGHVHDGGCPFKVVLMIDPQDHRPVACVYSSETGTLGDLVKTAARCHLRGANFPGALVGNALYWLQHGVGDDILVLDLDQQSLAMIRGPPITDDFRHGSGQIIQIEDGAPGLAILSFPHPRFQMWRRNVNFHGAATWELWKTIETHNIPGVRRTMRNVTIVGYSEDTGAFFIFVNGIVYMVQLKSMQSKRLYETGYINYCHPFTSFYTPGIAMAGGYDGAKLQDT